MFSYYGSKSKLIKYYPKPRHDKIIEPFAGSAKYSLAYWEKDVLLVDKYEVIIRIWKWLQQCNKKDIYDLPNLKQGDLINRNDFNCIEQFWLYGFMIKQGNESPGHTVSPFADGEIESQKKRIANDLFKIKHWEIRLGDYKEVENEKATWFIDPPYQVGGYKYIHSDIDYNHLGDWCRGRIGQIIVCENMKADWLDFKPIMKLQGTQNTNTTEAIWSNEKTAYDYDQLSLAI